VSPVPSHEALQYLPSGGGGQEHGGFLQVSSSAIISPLFIKKSVEIVEAELNTTQFMKTNGSERDFACRGIARLGNIALQ
jgi:hypothetical protein